jgi:acetyltransferase
MVKLKDAYEIILGSSIDPQFGPVLLFGTGGQLVEVFKDRALGLPPLNATLARRLMERTRIYTALKGVRGRKPVDLPALEQLLVRFSQLVAEQRWIAEIDINPLVVSPSGYWRSRANRPAPPDQSEDNLPTLAIRPYPAQYDTVELKDGTPVTIRPIRPEDEPLLVKFHRHFRSGVSTTVTSRLGSGTAHRPRTADAHLLQRLRSPNRASRAPQEGSGGAA